MSAELTREKPLAHPPPQKPHTSLPATAAPTGHSTAKYTKCTTILKNPVRVSDVIWGYSDLFFKHGYITALSLPEWAWVEWGWGFVRISCLQGYLVHYLAETVNATNAHNKRGRSRSNTTTSKLIALRITTHRDGPPQEIPCTHRFVPFSCEHAGHHTVHCIHMAY